MHFLNTLKGKITSQTPIWIMRQAGRYLPEYRYIRSTELNFIEFCLNADKASEVTCQPVKKFNLDAAIIFSDILLIPHMLDFKVSFIKNKGPKLKKLDFGQRITFSDWDKFKSDLAPVGKAINLSRTKLNKNVKSKNTPIIGFSGSPWTLFTYLTEGQSSKDFLNARKFLWSNTYDSEEVFEILIQAIICFLEIQLEAGVDAIMLFDSWAGSIPSRFRKKFIYDPTRKIVQHIRAKNSSIPIICFPKSMGEGIVEFADIINPNCIAVDHLTDIEFVHRSIPKNIAIQGNIDPICLVHGGNILKREVDYLLNLISDRPYIFNLGHGILPETSQQNLTDIISYIRERKYVKSNS